MKFLGSSKITTHNKITLTVGVVKDLKVKLGDYIIFEKDERTGAVCIKKG